LVELLVVIAIIGILVSLLLPAVQSARESARTVQCKNNLKQMSLAVVAHHQTQGFFPSGGWGWGWTGDPDRGFGSSQPAGWNYSILPFMEQQALFDLGADGQLDAITPTQQQGAYDRDQVAVSVFACPSRRQNSVYSRPKKQKYVNSISTGIDKAAIFDYACNAGDLGPNKWNYGPTSLAAFATFNWGLNDVLKNTGISHVRSQVSLAHVRDGATNTYMLGEKYLDAAHYTDGVDPSDDMGIYEGCAYDTYRWAYMIDVAANTGNTPLRDRAGVSDQHRFGSPHNSGCIFAFCDGSVRTISFSIDATTHSRLANRADGQAVDPSAF
jgi:prepilin-type processing-associated H-X9-DG protein